MRRRFWIECCALLVTFALWTLTIAQGNWLEHLLPGVTADHGDGTMEWAIVAAGLPVNISIGVAALHEWRRFRHASSPASSAR